MASQDRAQRCPLGIRSHLSSTPRCRCTGAKTLHRDTASTISPRSRYVAGSRHSSRPRSVQCWDALPPARHMFAAAAVPGRCTAKMRTVAFIIYPHGYLCRSTARVNNPFMPNWNMWALEPTSLLSHVGARYTAGAPVGMSSYPGILGSIQVRSQKVLLIGRAYSYNWRDPITAR